MVRASLSAIAGYVIMVFVVVGGSAVTWYGLGNRFAFVGDTNEASLGWSLLQLLTGGFAAAVGGYAAMYLGRDNGPLASRILLGMVLVLGGLSMLMALQATPQPMPEGKSIDSLTFTEAGQFARSPTWYHFAIVVVGCAGVWIGSRCCPRVPIAVARTAEGPAIETQISQL